jgi:GT2 family glycosyltransferase
MILICVAVYDTVENKRSQYTKETFISLNATINPKTTQVVFIDNNSCQETKDLLNSIHDDTFHVITNDNNEGTAGAINKGIYTFSKPGDFIVKLDNDVTFGEYGWADNMKRIIELDPEIGILGLKRKDLLDQPLSSEYPTLMKYINHNLGEKWDFHNVIEEREEILGTCTMYNPLLLEKVGYLYQPTLYGFDDNLMSTRARIAGFYNAFYPCIEIEHIDTGGTSYTEWKKKMANMQFSNIDKIEQEYINGTRPIYYNPYE